MISRPKRWICDASVAAKLFFEEPHSDKAHELFSDLGQDSQVRIYAPELICLEFANILAKRHRQGLIRSAQATLMEKEFSSLAMDLIPDSALASEALFLGLRLGISAYDAAYVTLSLRLNVPLVTADGRLLSSLTRLEGEFIALEDL